MEERKSTTSVSLSISVLLYLEKLGKDKGVSMATLIREAIEEKYGEGISAFQSRN